MSNQEEQHFGEHAEYFQQERKPMSDLEEAKAALRGYTSFPRIIKGANGSADWDIGADICLILSALTTAEQERDELDKELGKAIDERDEAEDVLSDIAALCGKEITSAFTIHDLIEEVDEHIESSVHLIVKTEDRADRAEARIKELEAAGNGLRFYIWVNRKTRHVYDNGKTVLAPLCVQTWDALRAAP